MKKRVAVLISGNGSNLQALIDASRAQEYPAEIIVVISSKPDAYGLQRAHQAGIDNFTVDYKSLGRESAEAEVASILRQYNVKYVCLAGFMRLLSVGFTSAWAGRMLNIHPSLLPSFKGAHAVRDALEYGVKVTGVTVHLVTAEMDSGPIIAQRAVAVVDGDNEASLADRIHVAEHEIYPQALRDFIEST